MTYFLKDSIFNKHITWDFLIGDINKTHTFNTYCNSEDFYEIFKLIILSLIIGKEIILLDSDLTQNELIKITGYSEFCGFTQLIEKGKLKTVENKKTLIDKLRKPPDEWRVTLHTSGTTGTPKKITHNFYSITRFLKISDKHSKDIWGFAYNPTHIAGLQVFFQSLLNGNTIVMLFGLESEQIQKEIKENKITHISATPTFYRLLLPCKEIFPTVRRITSGGERFNEKTTNDLKINFPNAKITNIYASTETGTLLATHNEEFSIKPEYKNLIRVKNNELLIHKSLVGNLDCEIKEWYETGDLIEIISHNPLKFRIMSRKNEMINVGGYKVNPIEIEEAILSLPGIKNVRVYSKTNSVLGNVICSEVVSTENEISEKRIRAFLQTKLQDFKIPRVIKLVNALTTTKTGKIKRNLS